MCYTLSTFCLKFYFGIHVREISLNWLHCTSVSKKCTFRKRSAWMQHRSVRSPLNFGVDPESSLVFVRDLFL